MPDEHPSEASLAAADTRQRILNTACALVVRDGYANLTLDAVARDAAVSKGGLLYHFPSKRALLEGMVEERCKQFETEVHKHLERETGAGRWLRAIVRASCSPRPIALQEGAAIFAVLANDPDLMALVRKYRDRFQHEIDQDGVDSDSATLIRLAVDGLCFNELLGAGFAPTPKQRERIATQLLKLSTNRRETESRLQPETR
jgi:AcrR family transcriptional regulator